MLSRCEVCGVLISEDKGTKVVHFSAGKPGTTDRLAARVCQFLPPDKAAKCINQGFDLKKIPRHEFYD